MQDGQPKAIFLKDYEVSSFLIDTTILNVSVEDETVRVVSRLAMRRNPEADDSSAALELHGGPTLETLSVCVDGRSLLNNEYQLESGRLTLQDVPDTFELRTEVLLRPQENLALSGLYQSGDMLCTQCEAEGFRNITWYLDRPDVMSTFETTIEADSAQYPVLLSNGNAVDREIKGDRHRVTWRDPFKKPAYLFALVAGDLAHVEDVFVTESGREVTLQIFTEAHNIGQVDFAMSSLKASMAWDEQAYGREYDLDIFMIVAVESFNMGAMENKGLNIFNTSCVLAHQDTTSDAGFQRVESVVAHEYFHNWSGNRVTCRDWFQLSLKEGFTVLRDQQFSADRWSRGACRVRDVSVLRAAQFPEDAGPMAHPIRPPSFIEINNFYTATVYEKGAEVVRMLHTLLGAESFRAGTDLYFDRHDGEAVTTDDFVRAMEDATGADLNQFRRWYEQAGTPVIEAEGRFNQATSTYTLTLAQSTPPTPGQPDKLPLHLPITVGLIGPDGQDFDFAGAEINPNGGRSQVLSLREPQQTFEFTGLPQCPVLSIGREFSAPIKIIVDESAEDLAFLARHDSDPFNRWDAGQRLAVQAIQTVERGGTATDAEAVNAALIETVGHQLDKAIRGNADPNFDAELVSLLLTLPSPQYLIELQESVDVLKLIEARDQVRGAIAQAHANRLREIYDLYDASGDYLVNSQSVAARSIKNVALSYLVEAGHADALPLAMTQFKRQDNMTDVSAALRVIENSNLPDAEDLRRSALAEFYDRWSKEALVVDQWFAIQASGTRPGALIRIEALMQHSAFTMQTPNRMRSVLWSFAAGNPMAFHERGGQGYRLLADKVIELNGFNPQMASRMLGPLTGWRKFDDQYGVLMRGALEAILASGELSSDVYEVVTKSLA